MTNTDGPTFYLISWAVTILVSISFGYLVVPRDDDEKETDKLIVHEPRSFSQIVNDTVSLISDKKMIYLNLQCI